MGDTTNIGGMTKLDLPEDQVLEQAMGKLDGVVLMGWDDGELYFASSLADCTKVLWLIEKSKLQLLSMETENDTDDTDESIL